MTYPSEDGFHLESASGRPFLPKLRPFIVDHRISSTCSHISPATLSRIKRAPPSFAFPVPRRANVEGQASSARSRHRYAALPTHFHAEELDHRRAPTRRLASDASIAPHRFQCFRFLVHESIVRNGFQKERSERPLPIESRTSFLFETRILKGKRRIESFSDFDAFVHRILPETKTFSPVVRFYLPRSRIGCSQVSNHSD